MRLTPCNIHQCQTDRYREDANPSTWNTTCENMHSYQQRRFQIDATCKDNYLLLGVSVSLPLLCPAERRWGLGMKEVEYSRVRVTITLQTCVDVGQE